jgi:hypothetical protein
VISDGATPSSVALAENGINEIADIIITSDNMTDNDFFIKTTPFSLITMGGNKPSRI